VTCCARCPYPTPPLLLCGRRLARHRWTSSALFWCIRHGRCGTGTESGSGRKQRSGGGAAPGELSLPRGPLIRGPTPSAMWRRKTMEAAAAQAAAARAAAAGGASRTRRRCRRRHIAPPRVCPARRRSPAPAPQRQKQRQRARSTRPQPASPSPSPRPRATPSRPRRRPRQARWQAPTSGRRR